MLFRETDMAMNLLLSGPKRLLGRRFAREVMTLQIGSFATLGLQFVTSVVITNILNAGPLGQYYLAGNVLNWVTTFVNLAVGQALITRLAAAHAQRDREECLRLLAYYLKTGIAVALLESALGLVLAEQLGVLVVGNAAIGDLARVLFVTPPFLMFYNMGVLALQSSRQITRLTLLENGALMGTSLLNVAVVGLGGGLTGLLYSVAFAQVCTAIAALLLYRATLPQMQVYPTLGEIVRAAPGVPFRRYFAFSALVSIDKNFANFLALAPTTLLGRVGNPAQVAYFRVAFNLMNFLSIPLSPISRNLYAKLAEVAARANPRELGITLLKVSLGAGAISVVSSGALVAASPLILKIYRPEFGPSQAVIYVLGIRFALLGFGVGLGPIYQVLHEMKLAIVTKVVPAAIMFGAGSVLVGSFGAVGAAMTLVSAYAVGDITNAVLVPFIVRRAARRKLVTGEG